MYGNRSTVADNVPSNNRHLKFILNQTTHGSQNLSTLSRWARKLTAYNSRRTHTLSLRGWHRVEKRRVKAATNVSPKHLHAHDQVISDHRQADFLKGVSHDLRTPLNVIIGICQFLERDQKTPLSPMHQDAVERMERNARALLQSVNHLMDYMRNGRSQ